VRCTTSRGCPTRRSSSCLSVWTARCAHSICGVSKNQPPTGWPPSSPLLHITFKPGDSNYISTFHQDGSDIQILDMLRIIILSILRVLLSLPAFTRGPTAHGRRRSPQTCIVRLPPATWRTSETTSVQNRCRSTTV
jgi:hypothetical protein